MDAALSAGQVHLVASFIPHDFIDLKVERVLCFDLVRLRVNKCDEIFFVSDCNGGYIRN